MAQVGKLNMAYERRLQKLFPWFIYSQVQQYNFRKFTHLGSSHLDRI